MCKEPSQYLVAYLCLARGAAQALENANEISEGIASRFLLSLLEVDLPKSGDITLGVADKTLAGAIKGTFPRLRCETGDTSEIVMDLQRGLRLHAHKLLKQLAEGDVERAQLGLGHAYSRARVKFRLVNVGLLSLVRSNV